MDREMDYVPQKRFITQRKSKFSGINPDMKKG